MHSKPLGWDGFGSPTGRQLTSILAWQKFADANKRRTALLLPSDPTVVLSFTTDPSSPITTGITLGASLRPIILSRALHGGLVTRAWFVVSFSAQVIWQAFEALSEEES